LGIPRGEGEGGLRLGDGVRGTLHAEEQLGEHPVDYRRITRRGALERSLVEDAGLPEEAARLELPGQLRAVDGSARRERCPLRVRWPEGRHHLRETSGERGIALLGGAPCLDRLVQLRRGRSQEEGGEGAPKERAAGLKSDRAMHVRESGL